MKSRATRLRKETTEREREKKQTQGTVPCQNLGPGPISQQLGAKRWPEEKGQN